MSDPKISFMSPFVFTLICMAMMGGLIGLIAGTNRRNERHANPRVT